MRTFTLSILTILTLTFSLFSCSSKKAEVKTNYKDTIYVAVTPTLDCLPLIVAKEAGITDSRQHCILLQYHSSKADCDTALAGGSVSAIFTDYVRANNIKANWVKMVRQKRGKKAKIDSLSIFPNDNLQLYLFTNYKARLNEAKQLTDKMIAVDRNSSEAVMAQHVLDSVKLSNEKAFLVNVLNYNVRRDMITSNIMDAVVLPEPYASVIRKAGHKSIYSTAHQNGNAIGCIVATRNAAVIKHVYNLGCHAINTAGIHGYDSILVKNLRVPKTVVSAIPNHHFTAIK